MADAVLNREYALRIAGVGLMMFVLCAWSLYDGLSAWPRRNRETASVRPALLATNLTAEAWLAPDPTSEVSPLDQTFAAKGLKVPSKLVRKLSELKIPDSISDRDARRAAQALHVTETLKADVYSAHDLQAQFVQALITLLLGLWAFAGLGLKARKRYRADDAGLGGNGFGAQPVAYAEIRSIDWTKWDEKGIVRLMLKSGIRLTLDGWHFSGMPGIVEEIQKHRPDLCPPKV